MDLYNKIWNYFKVKILVNGISDDDVFVFTLSFLVCAYVS